MKKTQDTKWPEVTLGELISKGEYEIRNTLRQPLSASQRLQMQGEYPYYGAASAIDSINDYRFEGLHLLVAEDGTVTDGNSPMLQLVSGRFWVSNHAHVLRGRDEQSTRHLYYFLRNINISPYITGAVQPKLSKENLLRVSFFYPKSETEKEEVVAVPMSLDDKIELLRQQNETLEQIAQALFNEWFIRPATKGALPKGWKIGKLGDVLSLEYGKSLKDEDRTGTGYPVIGSSGIVGYHSEYLVKNEGIVVGRKGTMGSVIWVDDSFFPIDTTFYVRDKLGINDFYFHFFLLKHFDFEKLGSDSAVPGLNRNAAYTLTVTIPERGAIEDFHKAVKPLFSKRKEGNIQTQSLSAIRDALLPKLMNGEVRVKS